jgi:hypothetical protein
MGGGGRVGAGYQILKTQIPSHPIKYPRRVSDSRTNDVVPVTKTCLMRWIWLLMTCMASSSSK